MMEAFMVSFSFPVFSLPTHHRGKVPLFFMETRGVIPLPVYAQVQQREHALWRPPI
jgi:hypothetical protein